MPRTEERHSRALEVATRRLRRLRQMRDEEGRDSPFLRQRIGFVEGRIRRLGGVPGDVVPLFPAPQANTS